MALLRGINVGGKNLIKMADLKACFEEQGFEDVATYIASGNVIFRTKPSSADALSRSIEKELSKTFGYEATVVVRTRAQMRAVVEKAPPGFGTQPKRYLSDVIFLKSPLTAARAVKLIPTHPEVDEVTAGPGVVYSARLSSRASSSRMNRVAMLPIYKSMTIRSWSTTTKLLQKMDDEF